MTIFFVHIPKSGGTSLVGAFGQLFTEAEMRLELHSQSDLEKVDWQTVRFCAGHFRMSDTEKIPIKKTFITMLREPRARLLSQFYFSKSHTWQFIEEYAPVFADAKRMTLNEYLNAGAPGMPSAVGQLGDGNVQIATGQLFRMEAFGILEKPEQSLRHIFSKIGLNVPPGGFPTERQTATLPGTIDIFEKTPPLREPITPAIALALNLVTRDERYFYATACQLLDLRISEALIHNGD